MKLKIVCITAIICLGLTACAKPTLYRWGEYENIMNTMYTKPGKADPAAQTVILTEDIQKAEDEGKKVPPGVHAHLAYMYYLQGKFGDARYEFEIEKQLFPESEIFINGIIKRMEK